MKNRIVTAVEALALSEKFGKLKFVDITVHNDQETKMLLITPCCAYCGNPNPTGTCMTCGAGVRDG